jgi:hypothetical protein
MQDELLHAPVQQFGDVQQVFGRARHLSWRVSVA